MNQNVKMNRRCTKDGASRGQLWNWKCEFPSQLSLHELTTHPSITKCSVTWKLPSGLTAYSSPSSTEWSRAYSRLCFVPYTATGLLEAMTLARDSAAFTAAILSGSTRLGWRRGRKRTVCTCAIVHALNSQSRCPHIITPYQSHVSCFITGEFPCCVCKFSH